MRSRSGCGSRAPTRHGRSRRNCRPAMRPAPGGRRTCNISWTARPSCRTTWFANGRRAARPSASRCITTAPPPTWTASPTRRRRWWRRRSRSSVRPRPMISAPIPSSPITARRSPATGWSIAIRRSSPTSGRWPRRRTTSSARWRMNSSIAGTSSGCARASWSRSISPAPTRRRRCGWPRGSPAITGRSRSAVPGCRRSTTIWGRWARW